MKISSITPEVTSKTTVTAIDVTFTHGTMEFTAHFTKTETWDANTDHTETEILIVNQEELPALSDNEDAELWAAAQAPDEFNFHGVIAGPKTLIRWYDNIDHDLLKIQSIHLAEVVAESEDINSEQRASIDGVLSMLDSLRDIKETE